jgi:hypothetical protein
MNAKSTTMYLHSKDEEPSWHLYREAFKAGVG